MDAVNEENYLIQKAKSALSTDPHTAKAWILTAKTLYPNNFGVQFEAYLLEKSAKNHEEAAKCLSYIILTFQSQPVELWTEISQLTSALRIPEGTTTPEQEFYVKMFQNISYEVQHKILLLTANHSDNNLEHCKLILLLLKRFPQAVQTHSPRLLETLLKGMENKNNMPFLEMLVLETLPLIMSSPPELPSTLVNRIMALSFEYYVNQMFKDGDGDRSATVNDFWKKIFEILDLCGRILKWEPFLQFNKNLSKDVYWQKIIKIVSSAPPRPSENKQILFCATILFVMSLQEYIHNVKFKLDDVEVEYILVEGFKENKGLDHRRSQDSILIEAPQISVNFPCTKETPICLVTAAQCWQLLHANEILKNDFSQLLMNLPLSAWLDRFLADLAVYLGRSDETHSILKDSKLGNLEKHLRHLSLTVAQPTFNIQSFDYLMKVLAEMPPHRGQWIKNLSVTCTGRHLLLLPLTKRGIIQYCTKILVCGLKQKVLSDQNVSDSVLGNLLVLLQLNWPEEQALAEHIFNIIHQRGHFIYLQFTNYIICSDFIEQFMAMWYPHGGDIHLEFTATSPTTAAARRIGTRGADKGVKDDFKQIMKQQILKCNEDIELLIQRFISEEHMRLVQNMFEK